MQAKDVRDFFVNGGKVIGKLAIDFYGRTLDVAGEHAFADAIESTVYKGLHRVGI